MQASGVMEFQTRASKASPACPVCGAQDSHETWALVPGREIRECDACGLVFVWPRIPQDFSQLPESAYYGDWQFLDLDGLSALYDDVISNRIRLCGPLQTSPVVKPMVLDVGCGAGHVLPHFRAHGWRVRGVDPWASVTEIGRRYFRLALETGEIETATTIEPGAHDIVMSMDVLQFVADPVAFVAACRRAMRPGGMFYAIVPNFGSIDSRVKGWQWHYFIPGSYLSYFTTETLTRLMADARFDDASVEAFGGPDGDMFLRVTARRPFETALTWSDLGGEADDGDLPPLDRLSVDEPALSPEQRFWRENGYLILPGFIPDHLIDRYCAVRGKIADPIGWPDPAPYLQVPEIRDLCLFPELAKTLEALIGEPMGLHLNLTGWVSTERDWHQDDYLNPPSVNGHYAAVWMALDDIKPDAGPFEFVAGSHRWPFIRQEKVLSLLGMAADEESWPWHSENLLRPFFETERARHGIATQKFLAKRGDLLIWHSRLLHRGSLATRPGAERRSMIAHFSAADRRPDMGKIRRHGNGGYYFLLDGG